MDLRGLGQSEEQVNWPVGDCGRDSLKSADHAPHGWLQRSLRLLAGTCQGSRKVGQKKQSPRLCLTNAGR